MTARTEDEAPPGSAATAPRPLLTFPVALAIYFALAVIYFLPAFFPGQQIFGSDWTVGGYFFHEWISSRFAEGELPKWVPYVYGGLPLFANPGSTYYPFRFLADLFFPVSKLWPALFVIHFTLAGAGMYLLARELGTRRWVALVAGLAFQFTGLVMSWVLAGHEGRIIVATFTPILFYFLRQGIRTGRLAPFAGAAASVGFSLLTFQIQSCYYLLLGAALWSAFSIWDLGVHADGKRLARTVALGLGAVAFGFLLASVNFLPFLDYIAQSPRGESGGRGYEYSISYSMPLVEVGAIAVPEQVGYLESYRGSNPFKLHVEYVGAVVLTLVALGFYYARRSRLWWFFAALAVFALTIALGGNTPIYRLYYELLPGTKRFRAPSISFFLVSFSLVTMAALALELLAQRLEARPDRRTAARVAETRAPSPLPWLLGGVVVVAFMLGAAASDTAGPAAYRFALFASITAGVVWLWQRSALGTAPVAMFLAAVTVLDLWIVDRKFFETVPPPDELFAPDDVVDFLSSQPGKFRVWHLPFPPGAVYRGQAGNYLMRFGIDQAGGEHGNQLQRWNEYLGAGEETYVDWHNFLQSPAFLDAANVRYIVTGVPLDAGGLREVHRGTGVVYENPAALPRAYLVPRVRETDEEDGGLAYMQREGFDPRTEAVVNASVPDALSEGPLEGSAEVVDYEDDRVVVTTQASRPALLVLADNYYAGWEARVDGAETPILRTNHALRGVVVPAGRHQVVFDYEPRDLYTGFWLYLVGMGLLIGYGAYLFVRYLVRSRRAPDAA